MSSLKKKYGIWALVTGASSGIGRALARQLGQKGFNLVLVARREPLLNELVLSPGLTDTPFSQSMAIDFGKIPMFAQRPEQVAKTALAALGRKPTVASGLLNKVYAWENRLIPRSRPVKLFGFLIDRAIRAFQTKQEVVTTTVSSTH